MKKFNDIEFAALSKEAKNLLNRANALILQARSAHLKSRKQEQKKAA